MIPDDVDDDHADAVAIDVRRWIIVRFDDDHDGRLGGGARIVGQVADAPGDQDPDVDSPVTWLALIVPRYRRPGRRR